MLARLMSLVSVRFHIKNHKFLQFVSLCLKNRDYTIFEFTKGCRYSSGIPTNKNNCIHRESSPTNKIKFIHKESSPTNKNNLIRRELSPTNK